MKKLSLALSLCVLCFIVQAQQKAITEMGEEVILYEDGSWQYSNGSEIEKTEIPTNSKKFKKDNDASFLLKSNRVAVGFYLDPKVWTFKKAESNTEAEYELQLKGDDLYGMIISEKIEIPLESLKEIAYENGRIAAPDLKIVQEEYRTVNGLKVLMLQMDGTVQGIKVSYFGYYYSNANGTVQYITYTAQNLLKDLKKDAEALLNGIVEIE